MNINSIIKKVKGRITEACPKSRQKGTACSLLKQLGMLFVVEFALYICMDLCCYMLKDREAAVVIRAAFADPSWDNYLMGGVKGIVDGLQSDPSLQVAMDQLIHPEYIRFVNMVWDVRNSCPADAEVIDKLKFKRFVDASPTDETETPVFDMLCRRAFSEQYYEEKRAALLEAIGFLISDIPNVKKAILLIGAPNSGKSLLLRIITRLVGESNVSNVGLDGLGKRFSVVGMFGKQLNICGEIPVGTVQGHSLDVFKSITGGDRLELESKGKQAFSGVITAKLLYAGNVLPTFDKPDGTMSAVERMHIIVFENSVDPSKRDQHLEEKLWNERNAIVRQALKALHSFVLHDYSFTQTPDEKQLIESLMCLTNPLDSFIESRLEFGDGYMVHISDVFDAYNKFAEDNLLPKYTKIEFRKTMSSKPGIRIGKGKKRLGSGSPKTYFDGLRIKIEEET